MSLKKLERQVSLVVPTIDELVAADHRYRPLLGVIDFGKLTRSLGKLYSDLGCGGYPVEPEGTLSRNDQESVSGVDAGLG